MTIGGFFRYMHSISKVAVGNVVLIARLMLTGSISILSVTEFDEIQMSTSGSQTIVHS